MKKLTLLLMILSFSTVMMFAGEHHSQQASGFSQNGSIHFSLPSDRSSVRLFSDDEGISSEESIGPSHSSSHKKRSGKEIAGIVVGSVGAGMFGFFWFTHLVAALVAPPIIASETGGVLTKLPACLGIMATSWIPVIGPFAAAALTLSMIDDIDYYFRGCEEVFGGIGAYCILEGLFEIAFLAMMISGFAYAGYQRHKSKTATALLSGKVMPIVGTTITEDKTSNVFGVRVRI